MALLTKGDALSIGISWYKMVIQKSIVNKLHLLHISTVICEMQYKQLST